MTASFSLCFRLFFIIIQQLFIPSSSLNVIIKRTRFLGPTVAKGGCKCTRGRAFGGMGSTRGVHVAKRERAVGSVLVSVGVHAQAGELPTVAAPEWGCPVHTCGFHHDARAREARPTQMWRFPSFLSTVAYEGGPRVRDCSRSERPVYKPTCGVHKVGAHVSLT